jgi:hypothetical protein
MNTRCRTRSSIFKRRGLSRWFKMKIFSPVLLIVMLSINVLPAAAMSKPISFSREPYLQTASTTFTPGADSYVESNNPSNNYGSQTQLRADGSPTVRSYLRFNVQGLGGAVTHATLRIYANSSSSGGYNVQSVSNNTWEESTVTYNNAPAVGNVLVSSGGFSGGAWTSVNVTAYITGNGSYNLALIVPGTTAVSFASRESGGNAPQLVVETESASIPTPTPTDTLTATPLPTATLTFTPTNTQPPTGTATPTMTQSPAATSTATPTLSQQPTGTTTPTATQTPTQAGNLPGSATFIVIADAYVDANRRSRNYGSATTLRADASPIVRSYLRFNVQGLGGAVTRATLRLYANSSSSGGFQVRSVSSNTWGESTITYNNAPSVGNVLVSSGSFGSSGWKSVDITSYIIGNGTYNLAITTSSSTAINFRSREAESGARAPQLIIETQGTSPTATQTLTSTPTSTATQTATATPLNTPTLTQTTTAPAPDTPTATQTPTGEPTPTSPSSSSFVLVGAGDIANCNRTQDELTAQLLDNIAGTVFTAGDNAYIDGSYTEYLNCYEPTWGRHKSRTRPSPGNHDYLTSGAAGYFQYFNNVASYYAYNLGTWRIYALNSEISASATSAQVTWLQNDLATNPSQCVLAYWHKARWSSGANHGNNSAMQTLWQVLYDAGAELVINGHEHNYERFAEMNASGAAASPGLREIVVGTGGAGLYPFGSPRAASQVRNNTSYGVLKLTLRSGGYDWEFVPVAGSTFTDSGSSDCH